jgi:hypothetical protein
VANTVHSRPIPPPIPLVVDLDAWLDTTSWFIPVPAPFDLRGGLLTGAEDPARWVSFSPSEHPWLATEFAHIATTAEPTGSPASFSEQEAALAFVNRYGVTSPWPSVDAEEGPPLDMPVDAIVSQARSARNALLDYGSSPRAAVKKAIFGHGEFADFLSPAPRLLTPRIDLVSEGRLRPELRADHDGPLPLFEVIRLQLLADFLADRVLLRCGKLDCGKLFFWSQGRAGAPSRTSPPRGPKPRFCSYKHALSGSREVTKR